MGTFPPSVTPAPPQGAQPPQGGGAPGGSPNMKLAMLGQLIQGLSQQFPQGQQGIQMMMKGLQMLQSSAAANSASQPPAAPPR